MPCRLILEGRSEAMNSVIRAGRHESIHTEKRIGHGKAMSPTLRSTRLRIIRAALSASMKNGMGQVFTSVIRDRMKPGQITLTLIPSFFSIPRIASPQVFTHDFVAEYDGHVVSGA